MKMKATRQLLAGTCIVLTLAGCSGMTTRERDTLVGAGIGTAAGAAITGDVGGAVVGGAVGGVVGNQVGKHNY
jgi:osmotically inducible lipoprotein OsmB